MLHEVGIELFNLYSNSGWTSYENYMFSSPSYRYKQVSKHLKSFILQALITIYSVKSTQGRHFKVFHAG